MSDENKNQGNQTPGDGGQSNQENKQPEKTFTQAELEAVLADRLKREKEKYKDFDVYKKAAEEYQKQKETQMSEQEKLQAKLADAERQLLEKEREAAEARTESLKLKLLDDLGLPKTWVTRIFGTTEAEIRSDAEELKKLLGTVGKTVGSGTNPPGSDGGEINPWKRETFNLTKQAQIFKDNPALAQRLIAEAK